MKKITTSEEMRVIRGRKFAKIEEAKPFSVDEITNLNMVISNPSRITPYANWVLQAINEQKVKISDEDKLAAVKYLQKKSNGNLRQLWDSFKNTCDEVGLSKPDEQNLLWQTVWQTPKNKDPLEAVQNKLPGMDKDKLQKAIKAAKDFKMRSINPAQMNDDHILNLANKLNIPIVADLGWGDKNQSSKPVVFLPGNNKPIPCTSDDSTISYENSGKSVTLELSNALRFRRASDHFQPYIPSEQKWR